MTTYLDDNFNRGNSNTVGTPSTVGPTWSQNATTGGGNPTISSDELKFGNASANLQVAVWNACSLPSTNIEIYTEQIFSTFPSSRGRGPAYYVLAKNQNPFSGGSGIGYSIDDGGGWDIVDRTNGSLKISGTYAGGSPSSGITYYEWFDVINNGANNYTCNLYISTSSSKPSLVTGTATFTVNTPANMGTGFSIVVDATNAGDWRWTRVLVEDLPPPQQSMGISSYSSK